MLLKLAPLIALAGCGGTPPPPHSCATPAGDLAQPIQLQAIAVDASGAIVQLHDGDPLLLQKPSQGGYVLYAGAAARNLMPCGATVTASLLDRSTGSPLTGIDQRRADFTVAAGGFWQSAQPYSQTPNIPACPDALHVGVVGRAAILHVTVSDAQSRSAAIDLNVSVSCGGDAACACACGPDPTHC